MAWENSHTPKIENDSTTESSTSRGACTITVPAVKIMRSFARARETLVLKSSKLHRGLRPSTHSCESKRTTPHRRWPKRCGRKPTVGGPCLGKSRKIPRAPTHHDLALPSFFFLPAMVARPPPALGETAVSPTLMDARICEGNLARAKVRGSTIPGSVITSTR